MFTLVLKPFQKKGGQRNNDGGHVIHQPFPTELNTRLRFTNRGILGLDGFHNSIFFISLAPNIAINRERHTIFGKVVGDTIYNLIKVNEFQVDEDERPLYPPTIERAEVISNPFPDVRPRVDPPWKKRDSDEAKKQHRPWVTQKNTQLLSFGEEGEEELLGAENGGNALTMSSSVRLVQPVDREDVPEAPNVKRAKRELEDDVDPAQPPSVPLKGDDKVGGDDDDDDDDSSSSSSASEEKRKQLKKDKKKKKKKRKKHKKDGRLQLKDVKGMSEELHLFKKTQRSTASSKDIEAKFSAFKAHLKGAK